MPLSGGLLATALFTTIATAVKETVETRSDGQQTWRHESHHRASPVFVRESFRC